MKKSFLALAVAAVAATSIASTASATTVYDKDGTSLAIYGRVQSVFYSDKASGVADDNKVTGKEASINTSGRLGFDLRSQITPGVAAFAKAEFEMSNGNNIKDGGQFTVVKDAQGNVVDVKYADDNFMERYLWVGVDFGQFGQVKIGKFEESIKYAISQTDIFDDWGCLGLNGNDDRREGVVQYQWSGYGVDALVSYAFAKDNEHLDGAYYTGTHSKVVDDREVSFVKNPENADLDYSVSAALGYTSPDVVFGPIAVRAGFAYGKFADGPTNGTNTASLAYSETATGYSSNIDIAYDKYQQFAIGASWGKLNIGPYVAVQYQQRKFDIDVAVTDSVIGYAVGSGDYTVKGYEFAAGYSFANGVLVRAGYTVQELDGDTENAKGAAIPVYVNWNINPNFQVWGEARFDAGTDDSTTGGKNFAAATNGIYNAQENVFSAGVRYNF